MGRIKLIHYHTNTKDAVPAAENLALGEIAVNTNPESCGLFVKDSNGSIRQFREDPADGKYLPLYGLSENNTSFFDKKTSPIACLPNIIDSKNLVFQPQYDNDLFFINKRGGDMVMTDSTKSKNQSVDTLLRPNTQYFDYRLAKADAVLTFLITLPKTTNWENYFGIMFSMDIFSCKSIKIECGCSSVWNTVFTTSENKELFLCKRVSGPSSPNAGSPFDQIKVTLSNFYSTELRIASMWLKTYFGKGLAEGFMDRGGGNLYGDIQAIGRPSLGSAANKFSAVYGDSFSGNAASATKVGNALTFNGKSFDGSSALSIDSIDCGEF